MSFTYARGYGLSILRKPGKSSPPVIRVILDLGPSNTLVPGDISNVPVWFVNADFTLVTSAGPIEFVWNGTGWGTSEDFPSMNGNGTLIQGINSQAARWLNAQVETWRITHDDGYITAGPGIYITWS